MSQDHCPDCGKPNSGIHTCSPQVKKLVRLTDEELEHYFREAVTKYNNHMALARDNPYISERSFNWYHAHAIMDAMEAKNK